MTSNNVGLMTNERRATFCGRLKTARENRGVSLEQIAASTKISRSLFRDLENNNLSRWPKGIYRRSYLRDYLAAINLSPEPFMAEFARLFPDDDAPAPADVAVEESTPLPLTLGPGYQRWMAGMRRRLAAAGVDAGVVALLWCAAALATQLDMWTSGTIVAFGYYSLATAVVGRSFGARWLERRLLRRSAGCAGLGARVATLSARVHPLPHPAEPPKPATAIAPLALSEGAPTEFFSFAELGAAVTSRAPAVAVVPETARHSEGHESSRVRGRRRKKRAWWKHAPAAARIDMRRLRDELAAHDHALHPPQ